MGSLGKNLGLRVSGSKSRNKLSSSLLSKFLYLWTGKYDGDNLKSDMLNTAYIKYGFLYNHYALSDARNISASGWHIPTVAEFNTLITTIGGSTGTAPILKSVGTTFWGSGNNGTNSSGFDLRGSGSRTLSSYMELRNSGNLWTDSMIDYGGAYGVRRAIFEIINGSDDIYVGLTVSLLTSGIAVRLVKDSTSLSDGEEGFYIGNDFRYYKTICIGSQEWMSENLTETKYQDGSNIELVLDSSWYSLTSGAFCYYNGLLSNAYETSDPDVLIVTNKDWSTKYIPPDTTATFAIMNDEIYIDADNVYDNFWLAPYVGTPVLNEKTHSDLISSETTRTFVKYSDFSPYNIYSIGILKAGAVLTDSDKIELNKYFKLWVQYWGTTMMDSGYMKDNRTLI